MSRDLECPHCGHWDEASPDYHIGADPLSEYEHECSQCKKTYLFTVDFSIDFITKPKTEVKS